MESKDLKYLYQIIDNAITNSNTLEQCKGMLQTLERWLENYHPIPSEKVKVKLNYITDRTATKLIEAIKETRNIAQMGLKEAKDLVEAGGFLPVELPLDRALHYQQLMSNCGIKCDIMGATAAAKILFNTNK